jgi:hypothetical protein
MAQIYITGSRALIGILIMEDLEDQRNILEKLKEKAPGKDGTLQGSLS